jgi:hypothetical protein
MALSTVSLTLKQKIFVNSKICFYNNDEKTNMPPFMECGKNSVAAADVMKPMVDTSNAFYINLICLFIC